MQRTQFWMAGVAALALAAACHQGTPPPPQEEIEAGVANPAVTDAAHGDGGVSDFYAGPQTLPQQPGRMLVTEPLSAEQSLSGAAQNIRILYTSTDGLTGEAPIAVSGALFVPPGDAPEGGWPLIAWAHGTVGVADVCAPSWNPRSQRDAIYLNHWLAQGYAVVASDYQGLGTPGGHPYLATRAASYSVLDSIRAVQGDDALNIADKVVLVGQSQGGGAAFATAGAAPGYAPDVNVVGTVATGTPYFTTTEAPAVRDPNAVSGVFAYNLYILHLLKQIDPAYDVDALLSADAKPVFELTRTACLGPLWTAIEEQGLSEAKAFTRDPMPDMIPHFPLMAYDSLQVKGPVFMGAGGQDADVPPEGQDRLRQDACAQGSRIEFHLYPELNHSGTVNGSLADSTPFVAKAFAGEDIPGNCPAR